MEESKDKKRSELIKKLEQKKIGLSYSWLKNFTSPIDFLDYRLKKFKQNKGMLFGSLCDVLILTPNDLFNQFALVEKSPTTDNQTGFCDELIAVMKKAGGLDEEDIKTAYDNNYKSGKYRTVYDQLANYINASSSGKMIIDNEILKEARAVVKRLLEFPDVAALMARVTSTQHKLEWTEQGWKFKGFLDFTVPNAIFDLKYSDSADPELFKKSIYNLRYDLQAGTYIRGVMETGLFEDPPQYFFLVYDKKGNYSIIELDYSFIAYGMRQLDFYIEALDRCVKERAWNESYNFFARTATAYKPKWAKAYPLASDPLDSFE